VAYEQSRGGLIKKEMDPSIESRWKEGVAGTGNGKKETSESTGGHGNEVKHAHKREPRLRNCKVSEFLFPFPISAKYLDQSLETTIVIID
jgi:hypothetical protein